MASLWLLWSQTDTPTSASSPRMQMQGTHGAWKRLGLDWSSWRVAIPPYKRTWSGWTGCTLAFGFLVVEGVFWAFAPCRWLLLMADAAGVGRSTGAADVPSAAPPVAAESLNALL